MGTNRASYVYAWLRFVIGYKSIIQRFWTTLGKLYRQRKNIFFYNFLISINQLCSSREKNPQVFYLNSQPYLCSVSWQSQIWTRNSVSVLPCQSLCYPTDFWVPASSSTLWCTWWCRLICQHISYNINRSVCCHRNVYWLYLLLTTYQRCFRFSFSLCQLQQVENLQLLFKLTSSMISHSFFFCGRVPVIIELSI